MSFSSKLHIVKISSFLVTYLIYLWHSTSSLLLHPRLLFVIQMLTMRYDIIHCSMLHIIETVGSIGGDGHAVYKTWPVSILLSLTFVILWPTSEHYCVWGVTSSFFNTPATSTLPQPLTLVVYESTPFYGMQVCGDIVLSKHKVF